jgi:predicted RNase H-like HicB family nuclease
MQTKIILSAKLPLKLIRRKRWVVASCTILDVHSQGETAEKAKKNLIEALTLFFISCFERGTLDSVLKQCGFSTGTALPMSKKKQRSTPQDYIKVPIPFIVDQTKQTRCHA